MKQEQPHNGGSSWFVTSATLIALAGVVGLIYVLTQIHPASTPLASGLLFFLIFVTFSAGAVPISAYINRRFATANWAKLDPNRLFRHGLETGILITLLAYLQLIQALDSTMAAVLIGVFILMETFFLTRS
ncbi:MAG: hypothetical protein AAF629_25455 [Chloroflexota bacterium]